MSAADHRLLLLGAGGHAKVVASTAQAAGLEIVAAFDDDRSKWGTELLGIAVQGPLEEAGRAGIEAAVIGVGDNTRRAAIAAAARFTWITLVHPTAWIDPTVTLGAGSVVFAGAIIQPDSEVGRHAIVNTGATVDHDCKLGDFCHLCPGVSLAGGVEVGEGALLGVGSSVLPGIRIGGWSSLGAGGVAARDLPAGCVATGVPARPRHR